MKLGQSECEGNFSLSAVELPWKHRTIYMLESLLSVLLSLEPKFHNENVIDSAVERGHKSITIDANNQSSFSSNLIAQEIPAIQEEGFVFEFIGCESTPNTDLPLTCNFLVENSQESERILRIYGYSSSYYSRVIDAVGNEIYASSAQLGNDSDDSFAQAALPSGIPLKASFSFSQAPEGGIRILDIGAYTDSTSFFDVEFRFSR
jgi:hypothetical protein